MLLLSIVMYKATYQLAQAKRWNLHGQMIDTGRSGKPRTLSFEMYKDTRCISLWCFNQPILCLHEISVHTQRKQMEETYPRARLVENNFLDGSPTRWPCIACSHSVVLHEAHSNFHNGCRTTGALEEGVEGVNGDCWCC